MCLGCRRRAPKEELRRIVLLPSGAVAWDPSGSAPGRGAYVCLDVRCFKQASRHGRLGRALRSEAGPRVVEQLLSELEVERQS